jgi:hypothetical protein
MLDKEYYQERKILFSEHLRMAMKTVCRLAMVNIRFEKPEMSETEIKNFLIRLIFDCKPTVICKTELDALLLEKKKED